MDTETRAAFAALGEQMRAMNQELKHELKHELKQELKHELTLDLKHEVATGFARMDRYFELQQAQFIEWRAELRGEVGELRGEVGELRAEVRELRDRVDILTDRVDRLEREVVSLRDFVTREITDVRIELRALRLRTDPTDEMRREVEALAARVDAIERRQQD